MSLKRIVIPGIVSIFVALTIGYISLVLYQNLIVLIQNIDYQLYQASNAPKKLIEELQQQSVITNSETTSNYLFAYSSPAGPKVSVTAKPTITPTPTQRKNNTNTPSKQNNKSPWIVIPKIGVNTKILTSGPLKKRMYKGVAIINAFGRPDSNKNNTNKPTILVSHRFGYVWWTPAYRRTHSFHNIDKLKPNDIILIRWKSKWYKYKIEKTEISATISSYNYDLILYSCINYTSKKRIIVYANLIK